MGQLGAGQDDREKKIFLESCKPGQHSQKLGLCMLDSKSPSKTWQKGQWGPWASTHDDMKKG